MRVAEFLRGLADAMTHIEDDKPAQATSPVILNISQNATPSAPAPEQADDTSDHSVLNTNGQDARSAPMQSADDAEAEPGDDTMIPPLQQKLEIMKKMAGLPNQATNAAATAADDEPFESRGE